MTARHPGLSGVKEPSATPARKHGKSPKVEAAAQNHTPPTPDALKPARADERLIAIGKAIADPRRLKILRIVAEGLPTCTDLRASLGISAPTLSHHLHELESAGLIEITRNGRVLKIKLQRKVWKGYLSDLRAMLQV